MTTEDLKRWAEGAGYGVANIDALRAAILALIAERDEAIEGECERACERDAARARAEAAEARLAEAQKARDAYMLLNVDARKALKRIEQDSDDELSRNCARAALAARGEGTR